MPHCTVRVLSADALQAVVTEQQNNVGQPSKQRATLSEGNCSAATTTMPLTYTSVSTTASSSPEAVADHECQTVHVPMKPSQVSRPNRPHGCSENTNNARSNLFVCNLPYTMEKDDLNGLFSEFGTIVSSAIMRNIHTGESLGMGFVRFETHDQASAAMQHFRQQPTTVDGAAAINVQWAKKQHDGNPVGEARRRIVKLFVRNVPMDCTVEDLTQLFLEYGPVKQVTIHKDTTAVPDKRLERRIAFIIYSAEGAAERAADAVHNTKPYPSCDGIPFMVKLAEERGVKYGKKSSLQNGTHEKQMNPLPLYNRQGDSAIMSMASDPSFGPRVAVSGGVVPAPGYAPLSPQPCVHAHAPFPHCCWTHSPSPQSTPWVSSPLGKESDVSTPPRGKYLQRMGPILQAESRSFSGSPPGHPALPLQQVGFGAPHGVADVDPRRPGWINVSVPSSIAPGQYSLAKPASQRPALLEQTSTLSQLPSPQYRHNPYSFTQCTVAC